MFYKQKNQNRYNNNSFYLVVYFILVLICCHCVIYLYYCVIVLFRTCPWISTSPLPHTHIHIRFYINYTVFCKLKGIWLGWHSWSAFLFVFIYKVRDTWDLYKMLLNNLFLKFALTYRKFEHYLDLRFHKYRIRF